MANWARIRPNDITFRCMLIMLAYNVIMETISKISSSMETKVRSMDVKTAIIVPGYCQACNRERICKKMRRWKIAISLIVCMVARTQPACQFQFLSLQTPARAYRDSTIEPHSSSEWSGLATFSDWRLDLRIEIQPQAVCYRSRTQFARFLIMDEPTTW